MEAEAARGIRDARMALRSAVTGPTVRWRGLFTIDTGALRLVAPFVSRGDPPPSEGGCAAGRLRLELDVVEGTFKRLNSRGEKAGGVESHTGGMALQSSALGGDAC